jgi:chemotaxis protein methyltransferase CheR
MMKISTSEFEKLRDLIYRKFGINLTEKKRTLVVSRLQKLLKTSGFENFSSYYNYIVNEKTGNALNELVNRISTNFTFFWREPEHFIHLKNVVLPEITQKLRQKGDYDLRIWCAAAATGEEPYMLAIILKEFFKNDSFRWQAGILATDISKRALEVAGKGVYPAKSLSKLPAEYKRRYFRQIGEDSFAIANSIKSEVTFRRFNLMNPLPFKKRFHVIFCRNVMIYFDVPTKEALVNRFYDGVEDGGYLYIGHSEALGRTNCPFKYIAPALYRKE